MVGAVMVKAAGELAETVKAALAPAPLAASVTVWPTPVHSGFWPQHSK